MGWFALALYIMGIFPMYGLLILYEDHPQNLKRRSSDRFRLTKEQMIITCLFWPLMAIALLAVKGKP